MRAERATRIGVRVIALTYLSLLLLVPLVMMGYRTFEHGFAPFWDSVTTPAAMSAFWLTIEVAAIAVSMNAVLGTIAALTLVRGRGARRFRAFLEGLIDLPFAISPVVVGIALILLYGDEGWITLPFQVIFSVPGIVLATSFVSLPFVVRELLPLLREIGDDGEEAAATLGATPWQAFWRVTLPAIRWGLVYGVVLSVARAIGEFGAVSIISGKVAGETQTLTLLVEQRFQNFNLAGAYAASVLLAVIALVTLLSMHLVTRRRTGR